MKNTKILEAIVGGFVILGIMGLVFLAYKVSSVNTVGKNGSYPLYANFQSISGLKNGASVTLAGVKIGYVDNITLNENYDARLTILLDNRYNKIPLDSSVSVLTQGLLGEKYLGLDLGAEEEYMQPGDEFDLTKSSIVLERLIDKFLFNSTGAQKN